MSMGTGVVLFVVGAILTFALNLDVDWIDLNLVGYILMVAGVITFVVGLILFTRNRSTSSTTTTTTPPTDDRL